MTAVVVDNAVTIDGGNGAALPVQGTAVVVGQQVTLNVPDFAVANIEVIAFHAPRKCRIHPTGNAAVLLMAANETHIYSRYAKGSGSNNWTSPSTVTLFKIAPLDAVNPNTPVIGLLLHA